MKEKAAHRICDKAENEDNGTNESNQDIILSLHVSNHFSAHANGDFNRKFLSEINTLLI